MAVNRALQVLLAVVLAAVALPAPAAAATTAEYTIVNVYPHDGSAWTEGLAFYRGSFYESTGLYGQSSLRRVGLTTGTVLQKRMLCSCVFGEGLAFIDYKAWVLTWKENRVLIFDPGTFTRLGRFYYSGQGWGLTSDGTHLVMSNGTSTIRFRNPSTFGTVRSITVTENGTAVDRINELEWVKGQIWANIWLVPNILIIDPTTGHVVRRIDFSALQATETANGGRDMNGIAYWGRYDRLFVTGKFWKHVYEIRLNAP